MSWYLLFVSLLAIFVYVDCLKFVLFVIFSGDICGV